MALSGRVRGSGCVNGNVMFAESRLVIYVTIRRLCEGARVAPNC